MRGMIFSVVGMMVLAAGSNVYAEAWFQGMGDLPGGDFFSGAWGVSADGRFVVGGGTNEESAEAVVWTKEGGIVGLGSLPGETYSWARAISADGTAVVGYSGTAGNNEAFLWKDGQMQGLGHLYPPEYARSYAEAVSGDGSVVVGDASGMEGFRWEDGQMEGLGDFPGGIYTSNAFDVSADGSIIVGYGSQDDGCKPFIWTQEDGMQSLGTLPGPFSSGAAYGISRNGKYIVGWSTSDSIPSQAFIWSREEGMVGLGEVAGYPGSDTTAYDVSDSGDIVVGTASMISSSTNLAFIWERGQVTRCLKDVLIGDYGLDLDGWQLSNAKGVSSDGKTIVGFGTNPEGNPEGWVAHLPEPATGLLFLMVGVVFLRRGSLR